MAKHAFKISKGASFVKIKWDEQKHKRDSITGKFKHKPGTEEFKAEPFGEGKASGFKSADVIKLHVKTNPKKPGTAAATDFAKYKDSMTVGEFKAAVGPNAQAHLSHDSKKGFITIHDPAKLKAGEAAGAVKPTAAPTGQPTPPTQPTVSTGVALKTGDYVVTSKTSGVKLDDQIKVHAVTNPKKAGSKAAADFDKYKDEMTVAEFHAAVGDKGKGQEHILHDMKKGFISIHAPADLAALKSGAKSPGQVAAEMKLGDKKLGVMTVNPFQAGTKNHDDFEAAATKLGLKTSTGDTVPPASVPPEQGVQAKLDDDDVIETFLGNKYTVGMYKKTMGYSDEGIAQKLQAGKLKVISKATDTATLKLDDADTIITSAGSSYNVGDLKKMGYKEETLTAHVVSGSWTHKPALAAKPATPTPETKPAAPVTPKPAATPEAKPATPETIQVAKIPEAEHIYHTVTIITPTNPYAQGTPEYMKYKSLTFKAGSMSLSAFYQTKALTTAEKTVALQNMVNAGHVKIITPAQKTQMQQQQAEMLVKKPATLLSSTDPNHQAHLEQVVPPDWDNATSKWSNKAVGSAYKGSALAQANHGSYLSDGGTQLAIILETRKASGLKFNSNSNSAVEWYTGSGYSSSNNTLRHKGFSSLSPSQKTQVNRLDKLIEPVKEDVILWRGVGSTHRHGDKPHLNVNSIPPPPEFTDMGFGSVTFNPYMATNFGGQSRVTGQARPTIFKVRVPKGTKAAYIGRNATEHKSLRDEAEVILARGTRYKYISTSRDVMVAGKKVDVIEVEIADDVTGGNL